MIGERYCIFLDKDDKYCEFLCQLGLNTRNIDTSTFVPDDYNTDITGGFRLFDCEKIKGGDQLISGKKYICEVTLPENDPDFVKVEGHCDSIHVNKIIIDEIYDIADHETIEYYDLYQYIIPWAAENGDLELLKYWLDPNFELPPPTYCYTTYSPLQFYINRAIENASEFGHIHILDWLKNESGFPFECTSSAIKLASMCGQIKTLQWWKDSGIKLNYCRRAIDYATADGVIESLNWWLKSGLPMSYTSKGIELAVEYGKIESIKWWLESGKPVYYNEWAIFEAAKRGYIDIIELLWNSKCHFIYTKDAIEIAKKNNHQAVVEWFEKSGLDLNRDKSYYNNPDLKFFGYDSINRLTDIHYNDYDDECF